MPAGLTQWDTLPWHTRLGGTIHAMREDGLDITTELEGEYRHVRYRLATPGSLFKQGKNREDTRLASFPDLPMRPFGSWPVTMADLSPGSGSFAASGFSSYGSGRASTATSLRKRA